MLTRTPLATLVVRACVGMAYPPRNANGTIPGPDEDQLLEEVLHGQAETMIQHNDLHYGNCTYSKAPIFLIPGRFPN